VGVRLRDALVVCCCFVRQVLLAFGLSWQCLSLLVDACFWSLGAGKERRLPLQLPLQMLFLIARAELFVVVVLG